MVKNNGKFSNREKYILVLLIVTAFLITLFTQYYGSTDIGDYSDAAKFFAGDYNAKIRSSHSYLLGFLHAPFVDWLDNFIIFKITSLLFLILIAISVYYISGKNKRALWLMALSPVAWYMAPWSNPVQLASLIFLWAFYFMRKYELNSNIKYLIYSGLLVGLGLAFWDTILYLGIILGIVFLYDKKLINSFVFVFFVLAGLMPRLILDQYLFNFAFFTTVKTFISGWVNIFGGIYGSGFSHTPKTIPIMLSFLIAIPLSFWILYKPNIFKENKKEMAFLTLSLFLLFMNPQVRYILVLAPIMILISCKHLDDKMFKFSLIGSLIITLFFTAPYILQVFYSANNQLYGIESTSILSEGISLSNVNLENALKKDLEEISKEYPNEVFVVGNHPDNYQVLAHFYWGDKIKEFVSMQDYNSYLKNDSVFYKKRFEPVPNIAERRQFWIEGGLKKNDNDDTDYESIEYAISIGEPAKLKGFVVVKKYKSLVLSKKI